MDKKVYDILTDVYTDTVSILTTQIECDYPHVCAHACGVAFALLSKIDEASNWHVKFDYGDYLIGRPGQTVEIPHSHYWLKIVPDSDDGCFKYAIIFDPTHIQFEDMTEYLMAVGDKGKPIYNIKDVMLRYTKLTGKVAGKYTFDAFDPEYSSYHSITSGL